MLVLQIDIVMGLSEFIKYLLIEVDKLPHDSVTLASFFPIALLSEIHIL